MKKRFGITLNPVVPVRATDSEKSEMVTQLLFGETFEIIIENDKWIKIISAFDSYEGWIDSKMFTDISHEEFMRLNSDEQFLVKNPSAIIKCSDNPAPIRVSAGSVIPFYDYEKGRFHINGKTYIISKSNLFRKRLTDIKTLLRSAEYFLNTPYLWGGRNIMGIDCSGFTQTVFRLNGIDLPRDASQQILFGEKIENFADIYPGDLAFFRNDKGNVIHVGIILTPNTIIHSSGDVHVDYIKEEGIFSQKFNKFTHYYPEFRRLTIPKRKT